MPDPESRESLLEQARRRTEKLLAELAAQLAQVDRYEHESAPAGRDAARRAVDAAQRMLDSINTALHSRQERGCHDGNPKPADGER